MYVYIIKYVKHTHTYIYIYVLKTCLIYIYIYIHKNSNDKYKKCTQWYNIKLCILIKAIDNIKCHTI